MSKMSHQLEHTDKKIQIIFLKNQGEILELKSTIMKTKTSLEGLNNRFELSEESASLRSIKIIQSEKEKK